MKITRMAFLLFLCVPAFASTDCFSTRTTHNSGQIQFCITQNGNVLNLQGPELEFQIGQAEGYAICAQGGTSYWDLAAYGDSGNWNAPAITQPHGPNTFPLTITRSTTDGRFTLIQTFKVAQTGKAVGVTMQLYGNADLVRWAEVNAQPGQTASTTYTSAFVWTDRRSGLLATPTANVGVVPSIVPGGAQDPCLANGNSPNFATRLRWTPASKMYFEYSAMR